MKYSALLLTSLLLSACAVYPTSRTFYEPDMLDGEPGNRQSCGYINTQDTIRRTVEGIDITISPAQENIPHPYPPSLETYIGFTYRIDGVHVDPSKIKVRSETSGMEFEGKITENEIRKTQRIEGGFLWNSVELVFPEPAGLQERITYVFLPGAVQIDGREMSIAPFHFSRVTKRDVYYGSINC